MLTDGGLTCLYACGQGLTQIRFCTDGVLLQEMLQDPLLTAYRCPAHPFKSALYFSWQHIMHLVII